MRCRFTFLRVAICAEDKLELDQVSATSETRADGAVRSCARFHEIPYAAQTGFEADSLSPGGADCPAHHCKRGQKSASKRLPCSRFEGCLPKFECPRFIIAWASIDSWSVSWAMTLVAGPSLMTRSQNRPSAELIASGSLAAVSATSEAVDLEARAISGDPRALDAVVRRELPRVERLLITILGRRSDFEDLVQTVFYELFRSLHRFRGESKLSTFIGGITVRVAKRSMRPTAWYRLRRPMPKEEPADTFVLRGEERVAQQEQLRRVRAVLDQIAPKKKIAFLLWAIEGLTIENIAETMEASIPATRSRIYYAQKEIKARAAEDPYLREWIDGGRHASR